MCVPLHARCDEIVHLVHGSAAGQTLHSLRIELGDTPEEIAEAVHVLARRGVVEVRGAEVHRPADVPEPAPRGRRRPWVARPGWLPDPESRLGIVLAYLRASPGWHDALELYRVAGGDCTLRSLAQAGLAVTSPTGRRGRELRYAVRP